MDEVAEISMMKQMHVYYANLAPKIADLFEGNGDWLQYRNRRRLDPRVEFRTRLATNRFVYMGTSITLAQTA